MKTDITVEAEARASRGKNEARRTRRAGKIPGVVYGAYKDPVPVAVSPRHISRILHSKTGHNTIFNLNVQGGELTPVMIVDGQYEPIKGNLLHVDLKRIDLTKRIRVSVPVLTEGEPKGVKQQGGLLEIITREIEIECLPNEIPENFTMDVSELMLGQSKRGGHANRARSDQEGQEGRGRRGGGQTRRQRRSQAQEKVAGDVPGCGPGESGVRIREHSPQFGVSRDRLAGREALDSREPAGFQGAGRSGRDRW